MDKTDSAIYGICQVMCTEKKINERQTKQLADYFEKLLALMKTVGFLETLGPVACSAAPGPSKSFTEKKSARESYAKL